MRAVMETRRQMVEKKNQQKAAALTACIFAIIVALCVFLTAFTISIPPPGEQFVAVGFADWGDAEEAVGDTDSETPSETIQEVVQEQESQSQAEEAPATDPIVTQTTSEISVPTTTEVRPDPPPPVEPEETPDPALLNALSSLQSSGGGGSQGTASSGSGNEGADDGHIEGRGVVSGDDGDWELEGRSRIGAPVLDEKPQMAGSIRVKILVDKSGSVIEATYVPEGSDITDSNHIRLAIRAAKTAKFTPHATLRYQQGFMNIRFELE